MLNDLRDQADFLRPYELIERALTRHDGRRQTFGAAWGRRPRTELMRFLAEALQYETGEVPSLTGFLVWMQTGEVEVKRRLDSGTKAIRVMTVHGAKGLESPIVILARYRNGPQD
jgi:ATP-dependent helicase/nuclease subunit A